MLHIAICDDEKYMSDKIKMMVSDFLCGKKMDIVISQFSNGGELLKYDRTIDILFLDIQMKDMDGMETARKLRDHKFKGILIFITVLKEMVFQSFEVQAFDYLVKPIETSPCITIEEQRVFQCDFTVYERMGTVRGLIIWIFSTNILWEVFKCLREFIFLYYFGKKK